MLGSDGQKMSKSLRNYPDVNEVFDRDGSDAMRWFLMSSPVLRGGNLIVTEEGIREGVRQVLLPLWSTCYFFTLYANARRGYDGAAGAPTRRDVLDRYLLAKTRDLVETSPPTWTALDSTARRGASCATSPTCSPTGTCAAARPVLGGRRRRRRRREAFDTLYTVLETLTRVAAPLLPLVSERDLAAASPAAAACT